ncbi:MAG: hypothetical protein U0640_02735 [Phycisphaerales bacterium]
MLPLRDSTSTVAPPIKSNMTPDDWWSVFRGRLLDERADSWSLEELTLAIRNAPAANPACDTGSYVPLVEIVVGGWPFYAVRNASINRAYGGPVDPVWGHVGKPPPFTPGTPRDLPLIPIWRGFLINTFLYTLAWVVAIKGISGAIREYQRFHRLQRGLCVNCRYDLKGTPVDVPCPECGATHEGSAGKMKNAPIARGD